ncbi:MAG TPA: hypothetical protein VFI99_03390 [Nocardioides sp.]|nr:hypothetical protein [Nocardioides sp.]
MAPTQPHPVLALPDALDDVPEGVADLDPGCDIPTAWCEAHHAAASWSQEGKTDLAEGVILSRFHHHRAHDHALPRRTHRRPAAHLPPADLRDIGAARPPGH